MNFTKSANDPNTRDRIASMHASSSARALSYQAGAAAKVLAATLGADTPFAIQSVSLPNITRTLESFSQAAAETGESRIYGGIHFRLAVEVGLKRGAIIGRRVERQAVQPRAF